MGGLLVLLNLGECSAFACSRRSWHQAALDVSCAEGTHKESD